VTIEGDGSGYLLITAAQDESFCWDSWHQSIAEAEDAALLQFGIPREKWVDAS
jgi:hypothetical protein